MLNRIAQILSFSASNTVSVMRQALNTKIRRGNKRPQSTTFKSAKSIGFNKPKTSAGVLTLEFKGKDSLIRLNTGGSLNTKAQPGNQSVPYLGVKKGGNKSDYIQALTIWAKRKYGMDSYTAKRTAFKIANAAVKNGQTVKAQGWLDDAKKSMEQQMKKDMDEAIIQSITESIRINLKY
jgi:hypothetical protein